MELALNDEASLSFNPFTFHIQIDDLALIDTHKVAQLSLKHAHLNVSWWSLFSKELIVEMAEVSSLHINMVRNDSELVIAGIDLSASNTSEKQVEKAPANSSESATSLSDWQFKLPLFSMTDVVLNLNDMSKPHKISLKTLSLNAVVATMNSFDANAALNASINDASLALTSTVNGTLSNLALTSVSISNQLTLTQLAVQDWQYLLSLSENDINELALFVDLTFKQNILLNEDKWQVNQPNLRLALSDIHVSKPELTLDNEAIIFELNQLLLTGENGQLIAASGQSSLSAQGVDVTTDGKTIAALQTFELPVAAFELDNAFNVAVAIERIGMTDVVFSKPSELSAAIYKNKALAIDDISWKENHLSINAITLDTLNSNVVLNADKQLNNLVLPAQKEMASANENYEKETTPTLPSPNNSPAVTFSLNKFELVNPSHITFTDESVTPKFEHNIVLNKALIASIDSRKTSLLSPFDVALSFDEHAIATVKGAIAPFGSTLNMNLDLQMSEFSLPPLSTYLRTVLGFDFLSGQLDNKVTLTIQDDELDGETVIDLRGFELASGNDTTDLSVNDGSAMGLNSALNMLKDSQGNVSLSVPLSGNVNEPSFGVSSVLTLVAQKAIMSQAKSYLINTFVPYANIITVASVAGEYLLRLEMNDLEYSVGQVDISSSQQPFVRELGALLTDKPKQQVKMCAVASMKEAQIATSHVTKDEKLTALKSLSKARGDALKKVLVEQYKIESSRLLLCAPKVDTDSQSLPRIEFNF